jgi:hypothetical protein
MIEAAENSVFSSYHFFGREQNRTRFVETRSSFPQHSIFGGFDTE